MSLGLFARYGLTRAPAGGGGGPSVPLMQAEPAGTQFAYNGQVGYGFTVGGSNLIATGARVNLSTSATETVRLWRVSDTTLLDSVNVSAAAGAWSSVNFASPIVLVAGTAYVVTTWRSASRNVRNGTKTTFTFDGRITANGCYFAAGTTMPTAGPTTAIYGWADLLVES